MSKVIPTLFLGLGGTGFYAISEIKKLISKKYFDGNPDFPLTSFFAIDTEFLTADKVDKLKDNQKDKIDFITTFDTDNIKNVERYETTVIPDNIKSILKNPGLSNLDDFVPEGADKYIIVKGDGASGVGLVGKIALATHFNEVAKQIKHRVNNLVSSDADAQLNNDPLFAKFTREERINVFIFCSFGGGTGKGMALIISAMVKEMLHEQFEGNRGKYNISIINYLPGCFKARGRSVANDESTYQYILKNQYATYKELEWCMTHGYNNEKFFKNYFNKREKGKTEDFINTIYNISPNLEDSGVEISSYSAINQMVAQYFTFLVMNEESFKILQSDSNETQQTETGSNEKGTGLSRNRKYSRIGRYSIVMPEEDLFTYSQLYYSNLILNDFLRGGIIKEDAYNFINSGAGKVERRPIETARQKCNELTNNFNEHYNKSPELNGGELHFPDVHNYQLSNFIKPITATIRSFDTLTEGFKKIEGVQNGKLIIDEFVLLSIKNSGLIYAKDFLSNLRTSMEKHVQSLIEKIKENNDYGANELLAGLGSEDIYSGLQQLDTFEFSVSEGLLSRLKNKYSEKITSLNEYAFPERFNEVSQTIENFRRPKKKGLIKRIFGSVDDEKIPFPEESKSIVLGIIRNLNKQIGKTWPVFLSHEYLSYVIDLEQHISTRLEKIDRFIELLNGPNNKETFSFSNKSMQKEKGVIKETESELLKKSSIYTEHNEHNVVGSNSLEMEIFAKEILPFDSIILDVHTRFNAEVIDDFFSSKVQPLKDDVLFTTFKNCRERLNKERFLENKEMKWSIMNYLNYLQFSDDNKTKQQLEENLKKMMLKARFLSSIDTNKFENSGSAISSFPQHNFLEIADPKFLPTYVRDWQQYTYDAEIIPQESNNRITLTRVQNLIPLFAFNDLQEAQKLYLSDILKVKNDEDKRRFKIKSHSSAFFMQGIDEPFGQTLQLDPNDVKGIWNLAFLMGVVNVDDNDYIKILRSHLDYKDFEHYLDPSKSQVTIKQKQWIKIQEYKDYYSDHFHLTKSINDLIFNRLEVMVTSIKGKSIAENYFKNKNYPLIPKPLYNEIETKLQRSKYRELKQYATDIKQAYLSTYEEIADTFLRTRQFVLNEKDLKKEYKNANRFDEFFEKLSKDPESLSINPAVKKGKIEKITSATKWQIIYDNNKDYPVPQTSTPIHWENIGPLYKELAKSNDVDLDVYSNELKLILTFEEFRNAISPFVTYHVVDMENKKRLTQNGRISSAEVVRLLLKNKNLQLTEIDKPARKEDWKDWKEFDNIVSLFNEQNQDPDEEDIFITPFD